MRDLLVLPTNMAAMMLHDAWLHSSVGRAMHRHRRDHGFESLWNHLKFSGVYKGVTITLIIQFSAMITSPFYVCDLLERCLSSATNIAAFRALCNVAKLIFNFICVFRLELTTSPPRLSPVETWPSFNVLCVC